MLARSPPLPIVIDYFDAHRVIIDGEVVQPCSADIAASQIQFAIACAASLLCLSRVLVPELQKFTAVMDGESSILEHLYFAPRGQHKLGVPENVSSATTTPPSTDKYRLSNRIAITHDTCRL